MPTAALLLPSLAAGSGGGQKLHWLSCEASAGRYVLAALVVAVAYPLAFAAARALSLWCERLVPPAVTEAVPGLTTVLNQVAISLAALVIPMLTYVSLRILTKTGDSAVLVLMMGAVAATLALIRVIPLLAGECADPLVGVLFFPFFPLGFTLLSGLYGYGLARATARS